MRVLILGGTGFTGPFIVRGLVEQGHKVAVFHRGKSYAGTPSQATHILGDRRKLSESVEAFDRFSPDVVVDMLAFTREDAEQLVTVFRNRTRRVVVAGSSDVYRAFGRLHGTEPGPPDPIPLAEEAPLRAKLSPHGEAYEKRWVEEVVMNEPDLPGTVLRLPAIHGPQDYRPFDYLKRMDDGRKAILMDRAQAEWRFCRGYAENVANAVVLATIDDRAQGRIYNVADEPQPTQREWVELIGEVAGWHGEVLALPRVQLPAHLQSDLDWRHHLVIDSSRIREELGYREVVPVNEGMKRTVAWIRANPPEQIDPQQFDYDAEDRLLTELGRE